MSEKLADQLATLAYGGVSFLIIAVPVILIFYWHRNIYFTSAVQRRLTEREIEKDLHDSSHFY